MKLKLSVLVILIIGISLFLFIPKKAYTECKAEAFVNLKNLRIERKNKIISYFNQLKLLAYNAKNDKKLLSFFTSLKNQKSEKIEFDLDVHYSYNYSVFYDFLFLDLKGNIFHTLKYESDFNKNIFKGDLSKTKLSNFLKKNKEGFSEFEIYSPSKEPAAFFAVKVIKNQKHIGWYILQCSINKINSILTNKKNLSRTTEIYLVDKNNNNLSQLRFIKDSTSFKSKIETDATIKFENKSNERTIKDYRGISVLSSYENFNLLNTPVTIIAEIDETEIITDFYSNNSKRLNKTIYQKSLNRNIIPVSHTIKNNDFIRVDINEFAKSAKKELRTYGVATCTAIAITGDKINYLAHLSPVDKIYDNTKLSENIQTNYLEELLDKIEYYDMPLFDRKQLEFAIIANHKKSLSETLNILTRKGIELSNIKFIFNSEALSSNVYINPITKKMIIQWNLKNKRIYENPTNAKSINELLNRIP